MATKKKDDLKEQKAQMKKKDDSKEQKAQVKFIGKGLMDIRKALASWAGDVSRHGDEIIGLMAENVALKKKVKRLETDPLYTVPQQLEKRVAKMEQNILAENVQTRSRLTELELKVKTLTKKQFKGSLAGATDIESSVVKLDERMDQLEATIGALEEALGGPVKKVDDGESAMTPTPVQVTLEEAIDKSKTEGVTTATGEGAV